MGCKQSSETGMNVDSIWSSKNNPDLNPTLFENDSEKTLFKTINLIRTDPKWLVPFIKNVKNHQKYTGANLNLVLSRLNSMKPIKMLEISPLASKACKQVNLSITDEVNPNCKKIRSAFKLVV